MSKSRRAVSTIETGLLLLFWGVYVAGYAWSIGLPDTARDVFEAYRIRHGLDLPLEGPVLGIPHAIHLGPIWFYLLAVPLWIHDSWLSLVLFEGAIAGLKIPLAWYCGRMLWDSRFGLLWAAAIAYPGWSSMEPLVPFNPNAIGLAVFVLLALALRLRAAPAPAYVFAGLGLAAAFAIHVHPTTAPIAVAAIVLALRARRGDIAPGMAARASLVLAGGALPFVPYVASQAMGGWPDWSGAERYVSSQLGLGTIAALPDLIGALFFSGARFAFTSLADWGEVPGLVAALAFLALALAAPIAAFWRRDERAAGLVRASFALVLALSCWVLLLRPTTPFYFAYVLMPAVTCIVAAGARLLAGSRTRAPFAMAGCALALQLGCVIGMAAKAEAGGGSVAAQALDVKGPAGARLPPDFWFPARHRAKLGRLLCESGDVVALHGLLAHVEDRSVGLDALFECGRVDGLRLGGSGERRHWVGLARADLSAAGATPACWIGPLGVSVPEAIPVSMEHAVADGTRYFPRQVSQGPGTVVERDVAAPGEGLLAVSNVLHGYQHLALESALTENAPVRPIRSGEATILLADPRAPARDVDWRLRISTTDPSAIDIVVLRRSAKKASCG